MTRFLLPCVWIAWGLSYQLMSWSLEAVDLFTSRLIIMPISGVILLALGVLGGAAALPGRRLWGQISLTGLFNMGFFQIFLIAGIATLSPSRTRAREAPVGTLLTLLAAISFSIGTVLTKRMAVAGDVTINAAWQILVGTVPVFVIWLIFARGAYFHPDQVRSRTRCFKVKDRDA